MDFLLIDPYIIFNFLLPKNKFTPKIVKNNQKAVQKIHFSTGKKNVLRIGLFTYSCLRIFMFLGIYKFILRVLDLRK